MKIYKRTKNSAKLTARSIEPHRLRAEKAIWADGVWLMPSLLDATITAFEIWEIKGLKFVGHYRY